MKKLLLILMLVIAAFGQYAITGPGGLMIELDTLDGFFGIGDTVGTGRPLMFDYHYPWERGNSPFAVMIDSVFYNNTLWLSAACGHVHLRPFRGPINATFDGFATQWNIPIDSTGSIIFTQKLRAVLIDDLPACEISYMAYNNDDVSHKIAFRQGMDILVGSNDCAPMAMGAIYTGLGDILQYSDIPYFWMAFEDGPAEGADQVVARGILRGLATQPEVFSYGDNYSLFDDCWLPDSMVIGRGYTDSGISILWGEQQVSPAKTYTVSTIYGFGEAAESGTEIIFMDLVPGSVGSACDQWAQNPFEAAAMLYNVSIAGGLDSVVACIHLDDGLSIVLDLLHATDTCVLISESLQPDSTAMASWLILADTAFFVSGPADATVIITVESSDPTFEMLVGTTLVHIPDPAGIQPVITDIVVPVNAISGITDTVLETKYYIWDDGGIDPSSMILQIGSMIRYFGDSDVRFENDTLALKIPNYYFLHGNRIFHGIIAVSDSDGCSPDSMPHISGFWVDTRPPALGAPYPPSSSIISDSLQPITIPIYDWPAGVHTLSITAFIDVGGAVDYFTILDAELTYSTFDSLLTFTPSTPYPDSATVRFCLTGVADNVDVGPFYGPRNFRSDSTCVYLDVYYAAITEDGRPLTFGLSAYPNPFNSSVHIESPLADRIEIFDINGRRVAEMLVGAGSKPARAGGSRTLPYEITWRPDKSLGSGIYYVRAIRGENAIVKRVVYLK